MDESEVMDLHYNNRDHNQSVYSMSQYDGRSMASKSIVGLGIHKQWQTDEQRNKQKQEYDNILAQMKP